LHQIVFRLGLRPRPPTGFKGLLLRGGKGREGKGEGRGGGKGREEGERGGEGVTGLLSRKTVSLGR